MKVEWSDSTFLAKLVYGPKTWLLHRTINVKVEWSDSTFLAKLVYWPKTLHGRYIGQ